MGRSVTSAKMMVSTTKRVRELTCIVFNNGFFATDILLFEDSSDGCSKARFQKNIDREVSGFMGNVLLTTKYP